MVNGSCLISGSSLISGSCLISGETERSARADLHAAQAYFSLPCGQGRHFAQCFSSFP
jgi:hypothetical protein